MGSVDGLQSPESTITALLASSGRLRSSLHPEPLPTIKYRDRRYESASEALDAYIVDFQRSLRTSETSVGQIEICRDPDTPRLFHSGYRNRDVLTENLTDRELDLLNLPSANNSHKNSDHLSVTTDDLLLLPPDGSLPVTRTSAFLSHSGHYSSSLSHSKPGSTPQNSFHSLKTPNRARASLREKQLCVEDLLLCSSRSQHGARPPTSFLSTKAEPSASRASHHLPRWITSHKSEMDFSGLSSIPELNYPAWLNECDIKALNATQNIQSWVSEKEQNTQGQQDPKGDEKSETQSNPSTLRLQFAEKLKAAESGGSVCCDGKPFRGDKISFLIQRAEEVLNSTSLGLCSPGGSEELLEADRSWDNPPVTFKSPVPVGGDEVQANAEESETDSRDKSVGSCSSGYSSKKHPGPVEALKQMLFSLQAVEQSVTQEKDAGPQSIPNETLVPRPNTEDFDSVPGGQSLKRALHHLGRLKSLVDEMNEKKAREVQQGELSRTKQTAFTSEMRSDDPSTVQL